MVTVHRPGWKESKLFYSRSGSRIVKREAFEDHVCVECGMIIQAGDEEVEISYQDERGWHTIYRCLDCWGERS